MSGSPAFAPRSLTRSRHLRYRLRVTTRAWFPTTIYDAPLIGGSTTGNASVSPKARARGLAFQRELLGECLQIREVDDAGRKWSKTNYPGGFTSYNTMNQLHRTSSTFGELERRLGRHVRSLATTLELDLTGRSLSMTDCWVNVMPRHAAHGMHIHPIATISGTYYVQTPRGCSKLKFEDPRLTSFMAAPPRKPDCRPENRPFVYYPAEAGHVILFESWLRHEVSANQTKTERVSISFNFNWF